MFGICLGWRKSRAENGEDVNYLQSKWHWASATAADFIGRTVFISRCGASLRFRKGKFSSAARLNISPKYNGFSKVTIHGLAILLQRHQGKLGTAEGRR